MINAGGDSHEPFEVLYAYRLVTLDSSPVA
jgi:hypothetical protein